MQFLTEFFCHFAFPHLINEIQRRIADIIGNDLVFFPDRQMRADDLPLSGILGQQTAGLCQFAKLLLFTAKITGF